MNTIVQLDNPDFSPEPMEIADIAHHLFQCEGRWCARFEGFRLSSVFQPIFSPAHQQCVGLEALVRVQDTQGNFLAPPLLFSGKSRARIVLADRICRLLHGKNFLTLKEKELWLSLNLAHEVAIYGRSYGIFFQKVITEMGLDPNRVVLEIMEHPVEDPALLENAVLFYRDIGCGIAIDDFGTGQSHFDRVWRLSPHIVKLDRNLIRNAAESPRIRHVFCGMVSLLQESGSLVLVEGIETEEEAVIALEAQADLVQGYYFGRPAPQPSLVFGAWSRLYMHHHQNLLSREKHTLEKYRLLGEAFRKTSQNIAKGLPLPEAAHPLMVHPDVLRCFCLTSEGHLLGSPVFPTPTPKVTDPYFLPFTPGKSRNNIHKPFLKNALHHPGVICRTRPYRSFLQDGLCVTLSQEILSPRSGYSLVFCCDIKEPWLHACHTQETPTSPDFPGSHGKRSPQP